MKVKTLIKKLKKVDGELKVFLPISRGVGNISEAEKVVKSQYGFFGKDIDCIIIEPSD